MKRGSSHSLGVFLPRRRRARTEQVRNKRVGWENSLKPHRQAYFSHFLYFPFSMLSCPTCHCPYTTSGENQPRLLALCGHTFCYKCLEERRKASESSETFQCPQCSLPCTENHVPNITIMKYVEVMNEKTEERVRSVCVCVVCRVSSYIMF